MPDNVKQGKLEEGITEIIKICQEVVFQMCVIEKLDSYPPPDKYVEGIMSAITSHIREGSEAAAEKITITDLCGSSVCCSSELKPCDKHKAPCKYFKRDKSQNNTIILTSMGIVGLAEGEK
jgi:hypothetical protein